MNSKKLAILMTCHNRCQTTLNCLGKVNAQNVPCDIYLVDDGSSDGTAEAVKTHYPSVKLLEGDGNLFWVGGMHWAFAEAMKVGYDYYLWLNDDTSLDPDAFQRLLDTHAQLCQLGYPDSIVVGSTRDAQTGQLTYGGRIRPHRWRPMRFELLPPSDRPRESETLNGNCVLIPETVAAKVGNLDNRFVHSLGDFDYGLRARRLGCSVWVAPGYIGSCSRNPFRDSWKDTNLPAIERWRQATGVKGALYPREWTYFARQYGGGLWLVYWLSPYVRLLASAVFKNPG